MQDLVQVISSSNNAGKKKIGRRKNYRFSFYLCFFFKVCTCENPKKNDNNRELQNGTCMFFFLLKYAFYTKMYMLTLLFLAENLRIQVSKLKENFGRSDYRANNESFQNNSNFFQQSKQLPSIGYIQQQEKKVDELKSSSISDYGSSSGGENTTTTDDSMDIYQRKSSSASSSSSERDSSSEFFFLK
jgi:hypothetical protein